ncbi:hypothetical protein, partial [Pseudoxanthomonas taiwanensis]
MRPVPAAPPILALLVLLAPGGCAAPPLLGQGLEHAVAGAQGHQLVPVRDRLAEIALGAARARRDPALG